MKSVILMAILMTASLFAGELTRFAGVQAKSATLSYNVTVYGAVDPVTSKYSSPAGVAQSGKVEVIAVYSPWVKTAKGWSWIELLKINADGKVTPDSETEGRLGVASLAEPNKGETIIKDAALFAGEVQAVVQTWPQWVKIKSGSVTGWVYISHLKLD